MKILRNVVLALLILLLLFTIVFLVYLIIWDNSKGDLPLAHEESGNTIDDPDNELLVLAVGVDDTEDGTPHRTDTIMLFRIQFDTGEITALSIPRDTRVYINGSLDKINHAYAYGGIKLTLESLRTFLGMDIDHYMVINFETVTAMIDAGGGVRYDIPEGLTPYDWETFESGDQVLNGTDSLSYLRHRNSYAEGDIGRVRAQQAFIKEAMKQILAPGNFLRYPAIIFAFTQNAETNIKAMSYVSQLFSIGRLDFANIDWHTLPGYGDYVDGVSYYIPDSNAVLDLVNTLFQPYILE